MKNTIRHITLIIAATACLCPVAASAYEPLTARIKITGGGLYDYVVIGENAQATDGYDNAYDALSPGDSLNTSWVSSYFSHPEWGAVKNNFQGDIRGVAETQEWTLTITSTLPAGTDLSIALREGKNILPSGIQLTARDSGNTTSADLITGTLHIPAPGPAATGMVIITARQQAGVTPPPEPKPKTDQTITAITFNSQTLTIGESSTLSATATSGLPVLFNSITPATCKVTGSTVTASSAGTCTVLAEQTGNTNYNPAPQIAGSINIDRINQSITITTAPPTTAPINSQFTITATATSALAVTYSGTGACSNSGSTFIMTAASGTCIINYNQTGNATYNPATQITSSVTGSRLNQAIGAINITSATLIVGSSSTLSATASSGLPVVFSSLTPLTCTVTGNTLTPRSTTACTVAANQGGNATYSPAPQVTKGYVATPHSAPNGDFNGDGKVDNSDVTALKKAIATRGFKPTAAQLSRADMNGDGKLTEADVNAIKKKVGGK